MSAGSLKVIAKMEQVRNQERTIREWAKTQICATEPSRYKVTVRMKHTHDDGLFAFLWGRDEYRLYAALYYQDNGELISTREWCYDDLSDTLKNWFKRKNTFTFDL